jgi:hypothetical protein|tara:strand:+ start:177 stop:320 length:144 start_codon:yes stop_codon:yes gene_type:complete
MRGVNVAVQSAILFVSIMWENIVRSKLGGIFVWTALSRNGRATMIAI